MMNGAKKSDSSIVPAKLANKAERSAAESVEGDDGTKRNAELQSTVRTQSREAVTQAQARIRGAVIRKKKEKLTALLHHINIDVLRWAFCKINWILDADISRFFDTLSREWIIRFVEHRIGDRRIIRLIQKWLKAGVL